PRKRGGSVVAASEIGHCGSVSLGCVVITYRRVWNGCALPRRRGHDGGHGTDGGTSHRPPVGVRPACRCFVMILEPTGPTTPTLRCSWRRLSDDPSARIRTVMPRAERA